MSVKNKYLALTTSEVVDHHYNCDFQTDIKIIQEEYFIALMCGINPVATRTHVQ
jgi:hypothetical protein